MVVPVEVDVDTMEMGVWYEHRPVMRVASGNRMARWVVRMDSAGDDGGGFVVAGKHDTRQTRAQ